MKVVLISIVVTLLVLLTIVGGAFGFVAWGNHYADNYEFDAPEHIENFDGNDYGIITAEGRGLYETNGDRFDIKGINFGNLFVLEGWMTVNSLGARYNEDGTFLKVNEDGIVEEYDEVYQEEVDALLAKRFTIEQLETLNDAYFESYCTPVDFKIIKDLGMNTVRVPLFYRNFLTTKDRYTLTDEELCARDFDDIELVFDNLDKFLKMADDAGLKVIVDMHGVMGGQSGFEHCGTRDIDFWDNEEYIEFMCNLWRAIAERYHPVNGERADLAASILAYDLVNEPTNRNEPGTGVKQWKVMDKMYEAIREVDEYHVVSIEGVWFFWSMPSPKKYDWENVLYQYHIYNWSEAQTPNEMYYGFQYGLHSLFDYDVPKLIGEFNFFGNKKAWDHYLPMYDKMGWGWTIWSYKNISVGYWDTSWGISMYRYNRELMNPKGTPIYDYKLKLDLRTASYEEILEEWSNQYTEGFYPEWSEEHKAGITYQEGKYKLYPSDSVTLDALIRYFDNLNAQ